MIEIREATGEDIDFVAPLFDAYRVFYRKESDLERATVFLKNRMQNKESIIYLAFFEEIAVGFTQLYPSFSSTRMKRIWILNDLYVDKQYRGKGISKLLINRAKELAIYTDAAAVMLETEKTNNIGNSLYPTEGFGLDSDTNHYSWERK